MESPKSQFNRNLLIILVCLFVLSIAAMIYVEWVASSGEIALWEIFVNILLTAIPMGLLYGPVYVLVVGWRQHTSLGQVSPGLAKVIHWAPRLAAILIIFFISLFSLDVFEMEASPLELLGGFLMHNIPSIILILLLIFSWNRPVVGFATYLAAALVLFIFFLAPILRRGLQNEGFDFSPGIVLFVVPLLFIAGLFYAEWKWLKPQHPVQGSAAT